MKIEDIRGRMEQENAELRREMDDFMEMFVPPRRA